MKWFNGDIASAISLAKTRNTIFVVYCEGKDENSKAMTKLIDNKAIAGKLESNAFVAIKIESDKEEYIQFAKIYQLVPVPSIFFIKNGIPIKIVTGAIKTVDELDEAINSIDVSVALEQQQSSPAEALAEARVEALAEGNPDKPDDAECKDGLQCEKPKSTASPAVTPESDAEKQEKIQKAMKLIEQKRIERVQEEKRLEKEREVQRRKEGQTLLEFKKMMEDQEMKQIKEDRLKEKTQAKADRQRVLDQIEQDKKERAARFGNQPTPTEPKPTAPTPPASTSPTTTAPNSARIQFKKPDGQSEIVTFDSDMLFADVHLFVKNDILHGSVKEFTLVTAFPRREFSEADFDKTLLHLNLTPASVLLIIPGKKSSSGPSRVLPTQTDGSLVSMLQALVMGLFSPVMALFAYLKTYAIRSPAQEENANDVGKRKRNEDILAPNDAAKKRNLTAFTSQPVPGTSQGSSSPTGTIPKSGAYKRQTPSNNIHRLHQNSDSEDDEEKKTYNGNSTQQL